MHLRNLKYVFFAFLIIFSVTGCGGGYATKAEPLSDLPFQKKADKMNEAIVFGALHQQESLSEDYLIGADDVLEIEAYNVEELKRPYGSIQMARSGCRLSGLSMSRD